MSSLGFRDRFPCNDLLTKPSYPSYRTAFVHSPAIHLPMAKPKDRKCQCQCGNRASGKLGICTDGIVGKRDPELVLCDNCYYEVKEINKLRRVPTCQYPPVVLDKIWRVAR
ncbi:Uu.00g110400.m01.CDS01 [Anthostomella pinea]|uniref:Uu.00g110400.m01.CDS01 n=1 Tax=Anthostomella pinea TaxID=933095 RepID=A0AAI8YGE3_9PEZI|nr:Uu.00g110400.m01.CDS01 [Anthostomella pinea]